MHVVIFSGMNQRLYVWYTQIKYVDLPISSPKLVDMHQRKESRPRVALNVNKVSSY